MLKSFDLHLNTIIDNFTYNTLKHDEQLKKSIEQIRFKNEVIVKQNIMLKLDPELFKNNYHHE